MKVRGHRIELREVEIALISHKQVKECIVVAQKNESTLTEILAYVVPYQAETFSKTVIFDFLRQSLPYYMIPKEIYPIEALPLTSTGKVARMGLSPSKIIETRPTVNHPAPQSLWEKRLAQVWAEVLNIEEPGIHDNFFDLGGHSLRVIQVINRIRKEHDVPIPIDVMFNCPTISEIAKTLESLLEKEIKVTNGV